MSPPTRSDNPENHENAENAKEIALIYLEDPGCHIDAVLDAALRSKLTSTALTTAANLVLTCQLHDGTLATVLDSLLQFPNTYGVQQATIVLSGSNNESEPPLKLPIQYLTTAVITLIVALKYKAFH